MSHCSFWGNCPKDPPPKDDNIGIVWGITMGIGGVFFITNIVTYCIARGKTKFYTPAYMLVVSSIFNFVWALPIVAIYCLANKQHLSGVPVDFSFPMDCLVVLMFSIFATLAVNVMVANIRTRHKEKGLELNSLGQVRSKIFTNYGCFMYTQAKTIGKLCEHGHHKDMNPYLQNNPPVLEISAWKSYGYSYMKSADYVEFGTWDKVSAETIPEDGIYLVKPEVELQMPEEMVQRIEAKKKMICQGLGDDCPNKLKVYVFGFKGGCVVGKNSKYYNFLNGGCGRAIHVISHIFGMSIFWDNIYHMKMKIIKPKVVVKISPGTDLRFQYKKGASDGDHEDATDLLPYSMTQTTGGGGGRRGYGNHHGGVIVVPPPPGQYPPGYPPQGYPPQGYPPQGYPPQPGYPPQGYPPQGPYGAGPVYGQPGYPPPGPPGYVPQPPPPPPPTYVQEAPSNPGYVPAPPPPPPPEADEKKE